VPFASQNVHRNVHAVIRQPVDNLAWPDRDERSAEAEHRAILEAALRPKVTGRQLWDKLARGEKSDLDFGESAREDIESADLG
jgi:hypothetical protein